MFSVLNSVETERLKYCLAIPDCVWDKRDDKQQRDQRIHYWSEISPYASWTWLAGLLHYRGESVAEAAAKRYFQRAPGVGVACVCNRN